MNRRRSFRGRLLAGTMGTTLVALSVAVLALGAYSLRAYHYGRLADMRTLAEVMGVTSVAALAFDDPAVAAANLDTLRLRPTVERAALYDARSRLFATYPADAPAGDFPALPESDSVRISGRSMIVFARVVRNDSLIGTVYLRGSYEVVERALALLGLGALVMALSMVVAYETSRRLQKRVVEPILHVAAVARDIVSRGDYTPRAERLSDDEVGDLVVSFNAMLSEIERRSLQIESANADLLREAADRERAEAEILQLNAELEARVVQRTAELEVANHELESFCYSVSHDLRAPLRAINGFGQALERELPADLPEQPRRDLARVRAATVRMGQLIEDLLNLSRVSRSALVRQSVDVSELALQVIAGLRQDEPQREVEVSVWEGMIADADPRLLRTALENLIGNAWKFTSRTAQPRIEVGRLRERERAVYFVRDNGAGFDMAYSDKLFGAFQRLHGTTEFPGTGIGLATVQRIVHRHGGQVWADAEVDRGAVFFFTLTADGVGAVAASPVAESIDAQDGVAG